MKHTRPRLLTEATLTEATLTKADLVGADLSSVPFLTPGQATSAMKDESTKMPAHFYVSGGTPAAS
ncbi:pentapeptide repeat-containing protein [Streptomyces mirabilis]